VAALVALFTGGLSIVAFLGGLIESIIMGLFSAFFGMLFACIFWRYLPKVFTEKFQIELVLFPKQSELTLLLQVLEAKSKN